MKKLIYLFALVFLAGSFTSCTTVDNGNEGFWSTYSDGVDENSNIKQGTHWHAPWTDIIQMNVRQQAVNYDDVKLKDEDQVKMTVDYGAGVRVKKGSAGKLYMLHGEEYLKGFVDAKVQGAVKDVFGKYSYVDILGKSRDNVEDEIETLIRAEFEGNFLVLDYVEVKDIQLPNIIQSAITEKEAQEQKNQTSAKKKVYEQNQAAARIAKARGDSTSMIIAAAAKAEKIKMESAVLRSNPEYIQLIKWQGYADGNGSPFGSHNVFGSGAGILIQK